LYPEVFGINSYTAATVLGYAIGVLMGVYLGLKDGRSLRDLVELGVVIIIAGVLGAKVFHTLFEAAGHQLPDGTVAESLWDLLKADPWHWARLFEAGYVFYGGAVFGTGFAYLYVKRAGLPDIGAFGDYAAPGFALGIGVGRIGCYMAGCCYGTPTDLPWAIQFGHSHASGGVPIHPVQLYDAFFGIAVFALCVVFWKKKKFPGQFFALFVMAYAAWRFTTEIFRGDGDRGVWLGGLLSTSQLVSLAVLPLTLFIYLREQKKYAARAEETVKTEEDVEEEA
jgi:phosphatidylglycerol:prolipoprotein diacylglycerol transferase